MLSIVRSFLPAQVYAPKIFSKAKSAMLTATLRSVPPAQVEADIRREGYEVVWKDWDKIFD